MGYREDQFFNLYSNYSNFESMQGNPAFKYPGRFAQALGGPPGVLRPVKTVKRGFMTSLAYNNPTLGLNAADSEKLKRRLFFQFNPSTITQSVNLTDEVLDPAMQSPGNLATPVPGNQNFMFEIFLDRQMEMNNSGTVNSAVEDILDTENLFKMKPESIGVLADLAVLYRLIGQGIDATTLKIAMELSNRAKAFANEPADASAESASSDVSAQTGSGTTTSMDQNINAGNYAFLTAIPVRVVFSSLFMVDGFVTGTTVRFTKFNANMVPVQCSVAVAMQAVYIGFARERTVFNFALEDDTVPTFDDGSSPSDPSSSGGYVTPPATGGSNKAGLETLASFEDKILKSFRIAVSKEKIYNEDSWHSPLKIFDNATQRDPSNYQIYRMINEPKLWIKFGFPLVKKNEIDLITKYLEEGNSFSIQFSFSGFIDRTPYKTEGNVPGGFLRLGEFSGGSTLVENSGGNSIVNTKQQWQRARHGWSRDLALSPMSGPLAGKPAQWLGLDTQQMWDGYKVRSTSKLRATIKFDMNVKLNSGSATAERNYSRTTSFGIPVRGSYFDFTFDTVVNQSRPGAPAR